MRRAMVSASNNAMNDILVIGHRNPDTDAICSAIGYSEFKRRTGMPGAVAARCGDTNDRIDFVLRTFGVPAPRFVADVSPKVGDVMQRNVRSVGPNGTAAEALGMMDEHNLRVVPVLDEEQRCRGLLSLFKVSKFLFPAANRLIDSRRVLSSLRNLAHTLAGELLVAHNEEPEQELGNEPKRFQMSPMPKNCRAFGPVAVQLVPNESCSAIAIRPIPAKRNLLRRASFWNL